jgi:hypothetical protein
MKRAFLLLLAACEHGQSPTDAIATEDGLPVGDCGPNGSASVAGNVAGVTIDPVMRAHQFVVGGEGVVIVLDEELVGCGDPGTTGEHLILVFCQNPTVGNFLIVDSNTFTCPGSQPSGLIEQAGQGDFAVATGGTIDIAKADGSCTSGTFQIDLMPDVGAAGALAGTFNAVVCP